MIFNKLMPFFFNQKYTSSCKAPFHGLVCYGIVNSYSINHSIILYKTCSFPCICIHVNPYLTHGFSHHYQLGESTFIFRGVRSYFLFFFISFFSMKFLCANRIAPDGTPRSAALHLGLCCLPMSHKKDVRLK